MRKLLISLTEQQAEYLKTLAANVGISVSELVRRIVNEHYLEGAVRPLFKLPPKQTRKVTAETILAIHKTMLSFAKEKPNG